MDGSALVMERFPVKTGPETPAQFAARFTDKHRGTDIFAPAGAELVAVADGKVRQAKETKGGFAVYLTEPDGSQYYYAHLDAFAYPLMPGETANVQAGDPVMARYAAANRDAEQFPDPDRFDITRENVGTHVAFGVGNHF